MSKAITSPVKHFPGTVTLSDPLTFPQVIAFQDALTETQELGKATADRAYFAMLPGLLACVEDWNITNLPQPPTVDNFPATPRKPVAELLGWLIDEITQLFHEAETVPNE